MICRSTARYRRSGNASTVTSAGCSGPSLRHVGLADVRLHLEGVEVGQGHDRARRRREVHAGRDGRDALPHLGHLLDHGAGERGQDPRVLHLGLRVTDLGPGLGDRGLGDAHAALRDVHLVAGRRSAGAARSLACRSRRSFSARSASRALQQRLRALHLGLVVAALEAGDQLAFPDAVALLDPQVGQPALDLRGHHGLAPRHDVAGGGEDGGSAGARRRPAPARPARSRPRARHATRRPASRRGRRGATKAGKSSSNGQRRDAARGRSRSMRREASSALRSDMQPTTLVRRRRPLQLPGRGG